MQRGLPFGRKQFWDICCSSPESANIPLSCLFPSTGPKRLATRPFGATTDWYFRAWTFLCPLYTILWFLPGLLIGRTVPSTNPQQLRNGAPHWWIASENVSRLFIESQSCTESISNKLTNKVINKKISIPTYRIHLLGSLL